MDLLSYGISLVSMAITIFLAVRFVKYITYFSKFFFAMGLASGSAPEFQAVILYYCTPFFSSCKEEI